MEYLKKFRPAIEKRNIVVPSSSLEEEKSRGINMSDNAEEEIFADFDGEKDKVKEWWLQPEVEGAVEEREEEEGAVEGEHKEEEGGEEREEASKDKDDLINSLREEEEEDDLCTVLKEAMEEMGDVGAEGLLEIGRAALRGMTEGRK